MNTGGAVVVEVAAQDTYGLRGRVLRDGTPSSDVTYGKLTAQEFRLGLRYLIP